VENSKKKEKKPSRRIDASRVFIEQKEEKRRNPRDAFTRLEVESNKKKKKQKEKEGKIETRRRVSRWRTK
jgi:hypothetical protein